MVVARIFVGGVGHYFVPAFENSQEIEHDKEGTDKSKVFWDGPRQSEVCTASSLRHHHIFLS